ncbi:MAG: hypothetical protein H6724_09055 [Sandaracinus sp.]|nr:hypothetical protein [Sandaracinus sp.]
MGAQHRELPLEVDLRLHATVEAAFADRDGAETLGGVDELRFEHERVERGIEMLGVVADRHRESDVGVPATHQRVRAFPLGRETPGSTMAPTPAFAARSRTSSRSASKEIEVEVGVGVEEKAHRAEHRTKRFERRLGLPRPRRYETHGRAEAAVSERPRRHVTSTTEDGTTSAAEDGTTNAA